MKTDADHSHTAPETVVWEGVLRPGQILHVPRGWWHNVRGTGDVSLHLTFGFTRATGIDWVSWLIDRLYADDLFRQDLPRFGSFEDQAAHHKALAERVAELAGQADTREFLADRDRQFPSRHRFSLPWPVDLGALSEQTTVEFTPLLPTSVVADGAGVALETGGKRYRFAGVAGPVLQRLVSLRQTTVGELRETATRTWFGTCWTYWRSRIWCCCAEPDLSTSDLRVPAGVGMLPLWAPMRGFAGIVARSSR